MSFERPAAAAPGRPTEDRIKDVVQGLIKNAEDPIRGHTGERNNLKRVKSQLEAVLREKRGEEGADSEGIAHYYPGYEADDIEELIGLVQERLVELESAAEDLDEMGPRTRFQEGLEDEEEGR
jgi:hypothetical protein